MLGRIKLTLGRAAAEVEKRLLPPAPLPAKVLASRVVLLGASVSDHWNIQVRYPCIEVRKVYAFDKSAEIDRLLSETRPPDAIIIKECAAYFPLELAEQKPLVLGWIDSLRARDVVVVMATVVPVTSRHASSRPGRLEGIVEYNDWVRSVASERGLQVLDLERALRTGPDDPHLDPRWATNDGLHLRRAAYRRRLDTIVQPVLVAALG